MLDLMKAEQELEEKTPISTAITSNPAILAEIIEDVRETLYKTSPLNLKELIALVMCHRIALKRWLMAIDKDLDGDDPPEWYTAVEAEAVKLRNQSLDN